MLKSLDVYGFKSFADRTRFDFSEGITCVVGPNGSGKSNVVDAIKWILGDQSPKSLRGKEMTDVIFNGSAGRKPSAFAEATLIFDNTTGYLPVEAPEVHIGRRLWRNGDAEYLINRVPARLRDVRELFMGTGTATSAYAIIEQGRVDQILQSNATARRAVFEEAAGISRFKARKVEALRKLERVEQNLVRLTDIVDEVESQLDSTRSQASKAAKFREVSAELREQWLGLAADDARHSNDKLTAIQEATSGYQQSIEELSSAQEQLEGKLNAIDVERAEFDDQLRQVERKGAATREKIASHETTIGHLQNRAQELEADLTRLRRQHVRLEQRFRSSMAQLAESEQKIQTLSGDVESQRRQFEERESEIASLQSQSQAAQQELDQLKEEQSSLLEQFANWDRTIGSLELQQESAVDQHEQIQQRKLAITEQIQSASQVLEEKEAALQQAEEELATAKAALAEAEARQKQANEQLRSVEAVLAEQRERRTAWDARRKVLEDLEERQEGVGIGAKEILTRARTSKYPPWDQVIGSVADLVEADLENAALLDVALGTWAQLIVLRNEKTLIEYLERGQSQISGRVGFVKLDGDICYASGAESLTESSSTDEPIEIDLSNRPGVIQRADRLATVAPENAQLVERLLGRTWIVATLNDAIALRDEFGNQIRLITLQGELLDVDGTLYVGAVRGDTSLVSRKSELRRLKNDIATLSRKIEKHQGELAGLGNQLSSLDADSESAKSYLAECAEQTAKHRGDVSSQKQELSRLHVEGERIGTELTQSIQRKEKINDELKKATIAKADASAKREAIAHGIAESEAEIEVLETTLKDLESSHAEEKFKLVQLEERFATLEQERVRLAEDSRQAALQRDEADARFEASDEKFRRTTLQILNTRALLDELWLDEERVAVEIQQLLGHRETLRSKRAELAREEAQLQKQRREIDQHLHKLEMEARDLNHSFETLRERIDEEYQIDLEELVASGASAYQLYLQSEFGVSDDESTGTHVEEPLETDAVEDNGEPAEEDNAADLSLEEEEEQFEPDFVDAAEIADDLTESDDVVEALPSFEDVREEIESHVNRLRRKLKMMGNVNTDSLRDLDELEERYEHLNSQLQDLTEAKDTLEQIIRKINSESERLFLDSFEAIAGHFRELFRKLFGGGDGDVILEDSNDVLECGIDVVARPPGKELRSISLLSGGEKTLTAVALLLAMFKSRPSPFCVLDEVDAALDEANVERYASVVKAFHDETQFIIITHHKRTMTVADVLYGVTMEQAGVSKRMAVRFEDVSDNGEIRGSGEQSSMNDAA